MVALSDGIEEILDRWIERVSPSLPETEHTSELIESYRDLARYVLRHGVLDESEDPPPDRELDHLLARIARVNRRSGETISSTLTRFGHLTSAIVSLLTSGDEMSDEALGVLRAATRVDTALDYSLSRLVRILEESAIRAHREQARTLAAMMDVLSHELDNRLGAARTAIDMLSSPRIELGVEDLDRVGSLVRSSLDDALETVDDVQSLVRSWGEEPSKEARRPMQLPVLLRTVVEELRPPAREHGVRLERTADAPDVEIDAGRLRLVLFNLVSNGIKYHDPGKDDRWVRIESRISDDGRLALRISDNGIGIDEAEHDDIFRFRTRVEEDVQGRGLGLAIASEAVDQLGGTLDVESSLGEGAVFTVTLQP